MLLNCHFLWMSSGKETKTCCISKNHQVSQCQECINTVITYLELGQDKLSQLSGEGISGAFTLQH